VLEKGGTEGRVYVIKWYDRCMLTDGNEVNVTEGDGDMYRGGCNSKVDKAIVSRFSQGLELIIGIFEGKSKVRYSGGR
jgi:hypothetical protein